MSKNGINTFSCYYYSENQISLYVVTYRVPLTGWGLSGEDNYTSLTARSMNSPGNR